MGPPKTQIQEIEKLPNILPQAIFNYPKTSLLSKRAALW